MAKKLTPLPGRIAGAGNRSVIFWQRLIDDQP